jgi:glucan biosynthesis protein C
VPLDLAVVGLATHLGQRRSRVRHEGYAGGEGGPQPQPTEAPSFWGRLAAYGREAQLPYYVLHQMPIIVIGYYVVQWSIGPLPKLLIITLSSMAITLLVYEFIVRRIPVVRWLSGMKVKR